MIRIEEAARRLPSLTSCSLRPTSIRRSVRRAIFYSSLPITLSIVTSLLVVSSVDAATVVIKPEQDTTLYEDLLGTSNGLGDYFFAGMNNRDQLRRALISFNVAGNVPPGATINSVSLRLHLSRAANGANQTTSLHRCLAEWGEGLSRGFGEEGAGGIATEGDATWADRVYPDIPWTTPGGDFIGGSSASIPVGNVGFYTWNSSSMISDAAFWVDNPESNFGWIVLGLETGARSSKRFDSRSSDTPSRRPELTIDYTPNGPTVGACCLPGDRCILLTPGQCSAQLGSYQGNNTTCGANPCNGVPVSIVLEPSRDNTLYEDATGSISNGSGEFIITAMNAALEKRRALLAFDLEAEIPSGAIIADATLTLRKTGGGGIAHDVTLHRMLDSWGEGSSNAPGDEEDGTAAAVGDATWLHRFYSTDFWAAAGGDYDPTVSASTYVPAFEAFNSWEDPGMVADLQAWVDDPNANHGWLVLGQETGSVITEKRFVSRESATVSFRPKLEITYSVPDNPAPSGLPDVPVPAENPITEEKRVLGKLLFWEEQLSSDNSISCGTCHKPAEGGADHRIGVHPGADLVFDTEDDVLGSPGVRRADATGAYYPDPLFGDEVQVTGRVSQTFFGGIWGRDQFWDGRAGETLRDPLTDTVVIPERASLESQALGPILSDVEMAKESRSWAEVTSKLASVTPMAFASDLPIDMADALGANPDYPDLFDAAFGDDEITPVRIAMAMATYERTLVADQTQWDLYIAGDTEALTPNQLAGAEFVQNGDCAACHGGPMFTTNTYRNIGLRPPSDDMGRQIVTGDPNDRGRFKVPSLRNVALRNRLMHTGQITDVADALNFYTLNGHTHYTENQDENIQGGLDILPAEKDAIEDFLINGLTDPRVAAEIFPFDRPTLGSENSTSIDPDSDVASGGSAPKFLEASAFPNPFAEEVSVSFTLSEAAIVDISIYSAAGQLVTKKSVQAEAGDGRFVWDGRTAHGQRAATGVYFVKFVTGTETATGRLVRVE